MYICLAYNYTIKYDIRYRVFLQILIKYCKAEAEGVMHYVILIT